jgi:hypothetical protein
MKNLTYLTESVERSRLNSALRADAFDYRSELLKSAQHWAPSIDVKHLGAGKYIVLITSPSRFDGHFNRQFSVSHVKGFFHVEAFSDTVLFVRCSKSAQWVKEEIMMGFVPF